MEPWLLLLLIGHEYCGAPLNLCIVGNMYIVLLLLFEKDEADDDASLPLLDFATLFGTTIAMIEMTIKTIIVVIQHFHPDSVLLRLFLLLLRGLLNII